MARGMTQVEFVDDDPPENGPGPDPATEWLHRAWARGVGRARRVAASVLRFVRRAWRRAGVRWVACGVAVAVVAILTTVHVTDTARERARASALATVVGLVQPLHQGLRALYQVPNPDSQVLAQGLRVGGDLVGAVSAADGTWSIVALDPATGARRWSTDLEPVGAPTDRLLHPQCSAAGALVLCTAARVPVGSTVSQGQTVSGWQTVTWVVDPTDGHVIRTAAYGEHTGATAVGGLIVVAAQSGGAARAPAAGPWTVRWTVTASDPATGAVRWTWTSEPVAVSAVAENGNLLHDPTDYRFNVTRWVGGADDVVVAVGDDTWVLRADGSVRTHVSRPGGWRVTEDGSSLLRSPMLNPAASSASSLGDEMLSDDGSWTPIDTSNPVGLLVDDGSAPDLLLRASVSGDQAVVLTAIDRHTGATRWRVPAAGRPGSGFTAMLLDGRVYFGADRLRAVDAATGKVIWTAAETSGASFVATDGRALLVQAGKEVVARSVDDGRVLWRDDLPASVLGSGQTDTIVFMAVPQLRHLVAFHDDGSVAVIG